MRVDGKFLTVSGKSNFDGTFTAVTQHDGKVLAVDGFPFFDGNFLAVDGNSNLDGKSPLTGTVHQFGTSMSENLPNTSLEFSNLATLLGSSGEMTDRLLNLAR